MPLFTKPTEQTQYILDKITTGMVPSTFKAGYYGDQELIPGFPAFCVESNDFDRELSGKASSHKFALILRTHIIIYHEKLQPSQVTLKQDEQLAEAVQDYLHTDLTLAGGVIFGYVERVRPGIIVKPGRIMLRATRLEFAGISQQYF